VAFAPRCEGIKPLGAPKAFRELTTTTAWFGPAKKFSKAGITTTVLSAAMIEAAKIVPAIVRIADFIIFTLSELGAILSEPVPKQQATRRVALN
jgi:hypothetical protein